MSEDSTDLEENDQTDVGMWERDRIGDAGSDHDTVGSEDSLTDIDWLVVPLYGLCIECTKWTFSTFGHEHFDMIIKQFES